MDGDKNVKKDPANETGEDTLEMVKEKLIANWKIILGVLVVAIILLNTFLGMVDTRVSRAVAPAATEAGAIRAELAALGIRLTEVENYTVVTVDHDAIRADIASIREAGEAFSSKLLTTIEAEERKLALLVENVANQKAHIEALRNLLGSPAQ